jgi:plasmid stabilization system protein ParE
MRPVRLRYTAQARDHIAAIYSYIGNHNPVAATHEWVVRGLPYIIVYQIGATDSDEVLVLGVFHGAQDRERE